MFKPISTNMRHFVFLELESLSFIMIAVLTVEPLSVLLASSTSEIRFKSFEAYDWPNGADFLIT